MQLQAFEFAFEYCKSLCENAENNCIGSDSVDKKSIK